MKNFKKYVIMTDDGPGYKDEFLTYSTRWGYYTTTPRFGSLSECDTFDTIPEAEDRCKDANSGTFGGWEYPFRIMELVTPYKKGRGTPELKEVKTITYKIDI
jgi:hypothetical protein